MYASLWVDGRSGACPDTMPLEATMLVLDNSEWMRNGDYTPSRWDAQSDAVNVLFDAKTNAHPENMIGVLTMAGKSPAVLATLTQDISKVFAGIHSSKLSGRIGLATGINVAQLALKHRQNKNQRQRIIAFVGSPVADSEETLVQLAKKLKKNNVAVDIISFGEHEQNGTKLHKLIETVNSHDNSHLVTVPADAGPLSDTLLSSQIVLDGDDDQAGPSGSSGPASRFQFGVDPNADPELALALRLSLEEEQARQRQTQENEGGTQEQQPPTAPETQHPAEGATGSLVPIDAPPLSGTSGLDTDMARQADHDDKLLKQALALSQQLASKEEEDAPMESSEASSQRATVAGLHEGDQDEEMTEEEAIARAIEMSMMDSHKS